jgi:hypothetical protein
MLWAIFSQTHQVTLARAYKFFVVAPAAWRSGHHIRHRNEKTRVRIPPGYKVFRETYVAVLLCIT